MAGEDQALVAEKTERVVQVSKNMLQHRPITLGYLQVFRCHVVDNSSGIRGNACYAKRVRPGGSRVVARENSPGYPDTLIPPERRMRA